MDDHDNTLRNEMGNEIHDVTHFIYLKDIPRPVDKLLKEEKNG